MTRRQIAKREWAVRYRREGREFRAVRFLQSRPAAERFIARLTSGDRPDLDPLVEITVESRAVGPWAPDPEEESW